MSCFVTLSVQETNLAGVNIGDPFVIWLSRVPVERELVTVKGEDGKLSHFRVRGVSHLTGSRGPLKGSSPAAVITVERA